METADHTAAQQVSNDTSRAVGETQEGQQQHPAIAALSAPSAPAPTTPPVTTAASSPPVSVRRSPNQTPLVSFPIAVYSHRGGPLEAPGFVENSLPAFRNSARLKVDLLELDVQMTKDGQMVVFHDTDLGRIFGPRYRGKRIRDFAYAELPAFSSPDQQQETQQAARLPSSGPASGTAPASNTGLATNAAGPASRSGSAAHAGFAASTGVASNVGPDSAEDVRIPLLHDVFDGFPTFPIQVDIKVDTPGLVAATHDLIRAQPGRRDLVLWGSFHPRVNGQLYALDPTIPLFMNSRRLLYLLTTYQAGLLPYAHIYESAAIIPWRIPLGWGRHLSFLNPGFFRALNARGVAVVVYGSPADRQSFNTIDVYRAVKATGANAVCTDAPSLLQRMLNEEGPLTPLPWATR